MPESGYYAPGTENDPRAPWNGREPVECPDCEGTGVVLPSRSDCLVAFRATYCTDGRKWDEAGRQGFKAWWRGETNIATPAQTARLSGTTTPKCETCEGEGYVNPDEIDDGPDPDDLRDAELDRRMDR